MIRLAYVFTADWTTYTHTHTHTQFLWHADYSVLPAVYSLSLRLRTLLQTVWTTPHTLPEQASGFLCLAHSGIWGRSTIVGRVLCGLLSMITFLIAYFLCLLLPSLSLFRSVPSSCGHSHSACKRYVNPCGYSHSSVDQEIYSVSYENEWMYEHKAGLPSRNAKVIKELRLNYI